MTVIAAVANEFDDRAQVAVAAHMLAVLGQEGWAVVRADAIEEVWDDGNATGLDGWTGPGRGSGEVDDEAIRSRDRVIRKVTARPASGVVL